MSSFACELLTYVIVSLNIEYCFLDSTHDRWCRNEPPNIRLHTNFLELPVVLGSAGASSRASRIKRGAMASSHHKPEEEHESKSGHMNVEIELLEIPIQ